MVRYSSGLPIRSPNSVNASTLFAPRRSAYTGPRQWSAECRRETRSRAPFESVTACKGTKPPRAGSLAHRARDTSDEPRCGFTHCHWCVIPNLCRIDSRGSLRTEPACVASKRRERVPKSRIRRHHHGLATPRISAENCVHRRPAVFIRPTGDVPPSSSSNRRGAPLLITGVILKRVFGLFNMAGKQPGRGWLRPWG